MYYVYHCLYMEYVTLIKTPPSTLKVVNDICLQVCKFWLFGICCLLHLKHKYSIDKAAQVM